MRHLGLTCAGLLLVITAPAQQTVIPDYRTATSGLWMDRLILVALLVVAFVILVIVSLALLSAYTDRVKKMLAKALQILAYVWYAGVGILVLVSIAALWWTEGFSAVRETFSPFNLWNYGVLLLSLLPGFLFHWAAGRLGPPHTP